MVVALRPHQLTTFSTEWVGFRVQGFRLRDKEIKGVSRFCVHPGGPDWASKHTSLNTCQSLPSDARSTPYECYRKRLPNPNMEGLTLKDGPYCSVAANTCCLL